VQVLVDTAPDLINALIPGAALTSKIAEVVLKRTGVMEKLEELVRRKNQTPQFDPSPTTQTRLVEQYTNFLLQIAREQPLLLILDDLHWIDSASTSLLFHVGRRIESAPILILGAYRSDEVAIGREGERHPLEKVLAEFKRYYGEVEIDLGQAMATEGQGFVNALLGTQPNRLGDAFRRALYAHTEGHPLFTVELLLAMQERGDLIRDAQGRWVEGPTLDWQTLPARVEGVIEERIHRLTEDLRQMLAVASVEGMEFTAQVVARVQSWHERKALQTLSQDLEKRHRLVQELGESRVGRQFLSRYRFAHGLFQHYLYSDLGAGERRLLHREIAHVDGIAVQLARHYDEAGEVEKAVEYLLKAGHYAVRLSAYHEGVSFYSRALKLLQEVPETPERARTELDLQIALYVPLAVTRGYGTPEIAAAYTRARELCQQLGEAAPLFQVIYGLCGYNLTRANYTAAYELATQCLDLAERTQDPGMRIEAYRMLNATNYLLGNLVSARDYAEQGLAIYDASQLHQHAFVYGQEPGLALYSWLSNQLWHLGFSDQAQRASLKARSISVEIDQPYSFVYALNYAVWFHWLQRQAAVVDELLDPMTTVGTKEGFLMLSATGIWARGWVALQGRVAEGIAQMQEGIRAWQETGAMIWRPRFLLALAETHLWAGQVREATAVLVEIQTLIENTEERLWQAEVYRLMGEATRLRDREASDSADQAGEAEAYFRRAIETAQQQHGKMYELQASMSLSRLWRDQGKCAEAHTLLAGIYGWFTEGFDTTLLQEAKVLLEELVA
jgi:tetratricopeptide (TPR) repeat protein